MKTTQLQGPLYSTNSGEVAIDVGEKTIILSSPIAPVDGSREVECKMSIVGHIGGNILDFLNLRIEKTEYSIEEHARQALSVVFLFGEKDPLWFDAFKAELQPWARENAGLARMLIFDIMVRSNKIPGIKMIPPV